MALQPTAQAFLLCLQLGFLSAFHSPCYWPQTPLLSGFHTVAAIAAVVPQQTSLDCCPKTAVMPQTASGSCAHWLQLRTRSGNGQGQLLLHRSLCTHLASYFLLRRVPKCCFRLRTRGVMSKHKISICKVPFCVSESPQMEICNHVFFPFKRSI